MKCLRRLRLAPRASAPSAARRSSCCRSHRNGLMLRTHDCAAASQAIEKALRPPNAFIAHRNDWHPGIVARNPDVCEMPPPLAIGEQWRHESEEVRPAYSQDLHAAPCQPGIQPRAVGRGGAQASWLRILVCTAMPSPSCSAINGVKGTTCAQTIGSAQARTGNMEHASIESRHVRRNIS